MCLPLKGVSFYIVFLLFMLFVIDVNAAGGAIRRVSGSKRVTAGEFFFDGKVVSTLPSPSSKFSHSNNSLTNFLGKNFFS